MTDFDEFMRTCDEKHLADRTRLDKLENMAARIFEILDRYKDRPTWIILGIITFLASALGVTAAELIHRMK